MSRLIFTWVMLPLAGLAWAQQPTISNIKIDSLDTTTFRVFFTVSPQSWVELLYGTKPGVYPYNTKSINCFDAQCNFSAGKTALSISGLVPGTTYYVLPVARPDPNDDMNICNSAACGAVEQTVTTLAGPTPAPVVPPQQWTPSAPDTSSYTVITMQVGPTGECQAAAAASSPDGWSVSAGDYVQTVLNEVGYGAVLEFPQGAMCRVPPSAPVGSLGYLLPTKPPDSVACGGPCQLSDPRHRWIVLRTKQVLSGDFPPFGSRITPTWAPKLAKLYSSTPNYGGQLFDAELGNPGVHHFWFQNMEWEDDPNYVNPTDAVDPTAFNYFARLGSTYQTSNNQFIVLDRIYAHGPGAPVRHLWGYELGGNYYAMFGCYTSHVETWRLTAWPSNNGTLDPTNTILTIPQNNFRFQVASPTLGMSGPAMATLSNSTGSGTVIGNLYKDHLEIQYTSGTGTIACQGCTVLATATPSTTSTALQLFSGAIAGGQFTQLNWNTQEYETSKYLMAFGVVTSDLQAAGGPYYFDNNYLDGVGEGFYIDPQNSNFANDDITYIRNHHIWPKNYFELDPNWVGWRYEVRQHWESKRSHRVSLIGNVFSYSWSYQNDGPAIFISGRETYQAQTLNDGISDVNIASNIVRHGRSGITCNGTSSMDNGADEFDPQITRRVTITNNFMFDLGRWKYCDPLGCPGFESFYFENRPGCQDLVIRNNTAGLTYGDIPAWLYVGGGTNLSNYIDFENNVLFYSQGPIAGGTVWGDWPGNTVSNHDISPAPNYNNSGASPPFVSTLNQSFIVTAATVIPNYVWKNNVAIGGWTGQQGSTVDLTQSQLDLYSLNAPADIFPPGNTAVARAAAAGFPSAVENSFQSSTTNAAGVDFAQLTALQGLTTGIAPPRANINGAQFSYAAPDNRACAVDVSPDGVNWNRSMDVGGTTSRSVAVSGLSPGTKYHYRILCYYEQVNDGVLYTDYTTNQITNGTFSTLAKVIPK
jgi:hypothetical protein